MKLMKKIISVFMVILTVSFILPVFASAETETVLKFNENGKFRIMMFADIQDDETPEETTIQLMKEALAAHKPDLVIYLGDNTVASAEKQPEAISEIVAPCVEAGVPFTFVFGNHDEGLSKEELLKEYRKYPGCLAYDADESLYGCANHNLPILSSDGSNVAFNLWMIDSGKWVDEFDGYDYVREDQIRWYKDTAAELASRNGGKAVPAMSFQHIVVPEVYEALGMIKLPLGINEWTFDNQAYLPVPDFGSYSGYLFEPPSPSKVNGGQMDAWLETGDVMATFCGHDHVNDYITSYKGIDIVNVPTVGGRSYSNDLNRGVGLITLDEDDLTTYQYEALRMYDFALSEGSRILSCEGAYSKLDYQFDKLLDSVASRVYDFIMKIIFPMVGDMMAKKK